METPLESKKSHEPQNVQRELALDIEEVTDKEHQMTVRQAIKLYPKAVVWGAVLSASCIMDGYDMKLIGSLFAQPAFSKAYGRLQSNGTYQITAAWQSGLNNGSNVGQMIGLCFAGFLSERLGFRKTMIATLLVIPCLIFIQFFAPNLVVLEVGQILLGESALVTAQADRLIFAAMTGIPLVYFRQRHASTPLRSRQHVFEVF